MRLLVYFQNLVVSENNLASAINLLEQFLLILKEETEFFFQIFTYLNKKRKGTEHEEEHHEEVETEKKEETEKTEFLIKFAQLFMANGVNSNNINRALSIWEIGNKYQEFIEFFSVLPNLIMKYLFEHERYSEANVFGVKALDVLKRTFGSDHYETVYLQLNLGQTLGEEGKHKESLNILIPLFDKDNFFPNLRAVRIGLKTIATQLFRLSKYPEARKIYDFLGNEVSNRTDDITLFTRYDFANFLIKCGNTEEGMEILDKLLSRKHYRKINKNDVLKMKSAIAIMFQEQLEYSKAIDVLTKVSEESTKYLGELHHDTLITTRNLGIANIDISNYEKAMQILEEIMIKMEKVLEEEKKKKRTIKEVDNFEIEILPCLKSLVLTYEYKREQLKALKIYNKIIKIEEKVLGDQSFGTLITQYKRACILRDLKKFDDALKGFNAAYEGFLTIGSNYEILSKSKEESKILLELAECLIIAVKNNNLEEIKKLIKDGTVLNGKDDMGWMPLHYAVKNGNRDIVWILLTSGADVTQVTNKGNTSLHIAALMNFKEIVNDLLMYVKEKGCCKLNYFINSGTTVANTRALHVAASNGSLEIVKSLLSYGAIYNIENKDGKTPLALSKEKSIVDLLKLIDEFFVDVSNGNFDIITKLRKTKMDELTAAVNARDINGNTLYQNAVINKYDDIASELSELIKQSDQTLL